MIEMSYELCVENLGIIKDKLDANRPSGSNL